MTTKTTWILIADEAGGRILSDGASGIASDPILDLTPDAGERRPGEIMADRPGRSFASVGSRRSSMEPRTDPVRILEQDFASNIGDVLEENRTAGKFDRLVIVTPPRMLGDLRRAFPEQLRKCIAAEFAKDLTKLPTKELVTALQDLLATAKA